MPQAVVARGSDTHTEEQPLGRIELAELGFLRSRQPARCDCADRKAHPDRLAICLHEDLRVAGQLVAAQIDIRAKTRLLADLPQHDAHVFAQDALPIRVIKAPDHPVSPSVSLLQTRRAPDQSRSLRVGNPGQSARRVTGSPRIRGQ